MAKKKSKKKNNGLLIAGIIAGVLLLLIGMSVTLYAVTMATDNQLKKSSDISSQSESVTKIFETDDQFVNEIKKHKYQPLSKSQNLRLENNIGTYTIDEYGNRSDNPVLDLKIPADLESFEGTKIDNNFVSPDKKANYNFVTIPAFGADDDPDNNVGMKFYSVDEILDIFLENQSDTSYPDETIAKFNKTVNGNDFTVVVVKFPMSQGTAYGYQVIYSRMLNEGSSEQTVLIGTCEINQKAPESDRENLMMRIFDLENTFGGFDES